MIATLKRVDDVREKIGIVASVYVLCALSRHLVSGILRSLFTLFRLITRLANAEGLPVPAPCSHRPARQCTGQYAGKCAAPARPIVAGIRLNLAINGRITRLPTKLKYLL